VRNDTRRWLHTAVERRTVVGEVVHHDDDEMTNHHLQQKEYSVKSHQ